MRIDAVTVLLDAPNATDDWTVDPVLKLTPAQNAIQSVYNEFRLENNNVFLPNRMSRLVKDDLTNRICKDEAPEEIEKVLYQAGSDIFDILARANLTAYQVKKDVSAAQYISAASLAEYRKFFATNIGWAIKDLHEAAEKNKEPKDGTGYAPYRETLAHLCIMTLISGMEWPEKKDSWGSDNKDSREYCRGTQIESKEAKLVLKFSELEQNLKNRTLNQRICVYDDFVRSDRLAFRLQRKSGELQCRPEDHRILSSQPSKPASYWQRYVDHLQGS